MKTKQTLSVLRVISWTIFFGLCIQTSTILFTFIFSIFNPQAAHNLLLGLDLSNLYGADIGNYSFLVSGLIILSGLKAYIFYLVVKIFISLDFKSPFQNKVTSLLTKIGYIAFSIWIIAVICTTYSNWLIKHGMEISAISVQNHIGGQSELFFLGMIVFVISQIFRRGIEMQSEIELTI